MGAAPKISQLHPFLNSAVIVSLSNGVIETLETMAKVAGIFEKSFVEKNWKPPTDVSVFLNLESPPCKGQIRFHFPRKALVQICKIMLNEDVQYDSQIVIDCLGEISNICYGYAKVKLNSQGYSLRMALPHPCKTEDLPEVLSAYPHIVIPFKVLEETCYIQIIIL